MVKVEFKGAKEMNAGLKRMRGQAVPNALRNTLNTAAFETRTIWRREIRSTFTLRNRFTEQSVRVEQARGSNMVATVGSVAPWMAVQEEGGTVRGKSGHKVIPRAASAGQKAGAPRTRLVRGRFYLGAIQVAHPALSGGRRQRNAIAIAMARKQGKNIVLLTRPSGAKGLFIIMSGGKRALKTRMLWDVSRSSVRVHAEPTLERSLTAVKPKLGHMLEAALTQQMQRLGIGT